MEILGYGHKVIGFRAMFSDGLKFYRNGFVVLKSARFFDRFLRGFVAAQKLERKQFIVRWRGQVWV